MHKLILAALALSACVSAPPTTRQAFRDPSAPIYSAAVVDLASLSGNWSEIGALQTTTGTCRKGGGMKIAAGRVDYRLCIGGQIVKGQGALRVIGQGRFALPGLAQPVWVLWVDGGYRTLVLGTPKGGFGTVLDRGRISPDREAAAREILDWNGYDLGFYTRF